MALLTWGKQYSVGIQAMDDQHSALFKVLNDLHTAMLEGRAQQLTGPLLRKLLNYTRDHFSAEEALLTSARYPGLPEHRKLHRELTRTAEEFADRFERGETTLNLSLMSFLRDWLGNHIQKVDKEYGAWLNSHGIR